MFNPPGPVLPPGGGKSKLILKKTIEKTHNYSILVMNIMCGIESNIKVLNNEIVICK